MVADALHDGAGTGVADAKALPGLASDEEAAARGAVEDGVADEHPLLPREAGVLGGAHRDGAAAHALADVVVGFAHQVQAHSTREEGTEGLARRAVHD